jgi:hypothetical protein
MKNPSDRVNLLIDDVHSHLWLIHFRQHLGTDRKKSRRSQARVTLIIGSGIQKVTGNLFDNEPIKWLIGIEGPDHISRYRHALP